ncbi:MAG: trypsin-like peptidase domain-containing protein [Bacteroidetes bacterium]|nr:trypsin-like peptidase domain-containing protein [Bacteroidota bacterium]
MFPISRFASSLLLALFLIFPTHACNAGKDPQETPDPPSRQTAAANGPEAERQITDSRRNAITRAIEAVSPAVVGINATRVQRRRDDLFYRMFFGERYAMMPVLGSGYIISSDGYVLTNDHVAGNAEDISITMTNREKIPARLVGSDPVTDIALLRLETDQELPYIELGNSDDVIVGEWSIAFGNPFGLMSTGARATVTVGVISATHVTLEETDGRIYRDMIQTDAAINSGNSGGPLVNSLGQVIAMNTVIFSPNQGNVGLGFAIPINRVRKIVEILKKEGKVNREFVPGFRVQQVNDAIAQAYGLDRAEGVIVTQITSSRGVAARSGLEVADIILTANGEPVYSIGVLEGLIRYSLRGEVIELDVLRNNKTRTIKMKLE